MDEKELINLTRQISSNNYTSKELDLSDKKLSTNQIQLICKALEKNTTIMSVNFGSNKISVTGVKEIAKMLENNTKIGFINFRDNNIKDEGVKVLTEALKLNTTITYIDLSGNNIKYEGAKALAETFKVNTTITSIDLTLNYIGDNGVKELAKALESNIAVTSINLCLNQIKYEGIIAIAKVLKQNTTITSINLSATCNIADHGIQELAKALEKNTTISFVNLESVRIGNGAKIRFVDVLKKHPAITEVEGIEVDKELQAVLDFNKHIRKNREYAERIILINEKECKDLTIDEKTFILNTIQDKHKFDYLKNANIMANDPTGIMTNRGVYSDADLLKTQEKFSKMKTEVSEDIKFIGGYFATRFEQQTKFKVVTAAQLENVTIEKQGIEKQGIEKQGIEKIAADVNILNNDAAYYIDALQNSESEQENKVRQKRYTKDLTYKRHVKILKNIGIIVEINSNNNNAKPVFVIDTAENKLDELKKQPDIDKNVLVTALIKHGASEASISYVVDAFKPTAEVKEVAIVNHAENVQKK